MNTNTTESKPKTVSQSLTDIAEKVKALKTKENEFLTLALENKVNALMVAFDIGEIISEEVIAPYGEGRINEFARLCGFESAKTVYNYASLYKAAGIKLVLMEHSDLPRTYWYAIGASIKCWDDLIGDKVRRFLLQYPLWREMRQNEPPDQDDPLKKRVVDMDLLQDIGRYLKDLRDELKKDGILYAFQRFDLYLGKPPQGDNEVADFLEQEDPIYSIGEDEHGAVHTFHIDKMPSFEGEDPVDLFYHLSFKEGEMEQYEEGCRKIAITLDVIAQSAGHPECIGLYAGEETDAVLSEHRLEPKAYKGGYTGVKWALEKKVTLNAIRATAGNAPDLPEDPLNGIKTNIIHGNCEDVLKTDSFSKEMIDVVITDPPYGKYEAWRDKTKVVFDEIESPEKAADLVGSIAKILVEHELIKERFVWLSFCPVDFVHIFLPPLLDAFNGTSFIHQVLIWDKVSPGKVGGHQTFARRAEAILYVNVGDRPLCTTKVNGRDAQLHSSLMKYKVDPKDGKNEFWKPVKLIEHLIRVTTGSDKSEKANKQLILDPFAGKGTTGVACLNCHRDYRLIESHEGQFNAAMENLIVAAA